MSRFKRRVEMGQFSKVPRTHTPSVHCSAPPGLLHPYSQRRPSLAQASPSRGDTAGQPAGAALHCHTGGRVQVTTGNASHGVQSQNDPPTVHTAPGAAHDPAASSVAGHCAAGGGLAHQGCSEGVASGCTRHTVPSQYTTARHSRRGSVPYSHVIAVVHGTPSAGCVDGHREAPASATAGASADPSRAASTAGGPSDPASTAASLPVTVVLHPTSSSPAHPHRHRSFMGRG